MRRSTQSVPISPVLCRLLTLAFAACTGIASAQNSPHIGYVYPAGGQQGTVLLVTVGGQFLAGCDGAYVSGEGVRASVVRYVRPLNDNERGYARAFVRDLVKRRWGPTAVGKVAKPAPDAEMLPDHPWLYGLDRMTPGELSLLRARLSDDKKQPNAQIAEQVQVEVSIDADAPLGDRELRLVTAGGLSNPMCFQVGSLPELREGEDTGADSPDVPAADLPVLINGQVMPGEVDRFRVNARKGQQLVLRTQARHLVPYLADAVPGWFQAILALYDPQGKRVGFADDFGSDPDPVLRYQVERDGTYTVEIRDSIYRGREDFVYRIAVGELPFVTHVFPLGGREGETVAANLGGWNLPVAEITLDTSPGQHSVRLARVEGIPEPVAYAVNAVPERIEREPNNLPGQAEGVALPVIVNGRIDKPGDVDSFGFEGRAGEEIVAEVFARRLGSPLDAALRLVGPGGDVVAANDDHDDLAAALMAHQADPYLMATLPADGAYRVDVLDIQRQGGEAHGYRLHLRFPRPDFELRVTPSSINMPGRRAAQVTVHALRRDGFASEIALTLKDAPDGFTLVGGKIAAEKASAQVTVNAPRDAGFGVFPVQIQGRAQIGDDVVTRTAIAAEDMMQAFAYRHLVPCEELLVAVTGARTVPVVWRPLAPGMSVDLGENLPIPLGGTSTVHIYAPETLPDQIQSPLETVRFDLSAAPRGITLVGASPVPGGVDVIIEADANVARCGDSGYLILEARRGDRGQGASGQRAGVDRYVSLGVLPAIPCEVVRPEL
ncbi:MAG: hypothetical protein HPY44_16205 [Armatimonadetes bacterium]|nr:hypothetical protein [Armatimonadota bacterium]